MFRFNCIKILILLIIGSLANIVNSLEVTCQSASLPAPFVNSNGQCECIRGYKWNGTKCLLEGESTSDAEPTTKHTTFEVTFTTATSKAPTQVTPQGTTPTTTQTTTQTPTQTNVTTITTEPTMPTIAITTPTPTQATSKSTPSKTSVQTTTLTSTQVSNEQTTTEKPTTRLIDPSINTFIDIIARAERALKEYNGIHRYQIELEIKDMKDLLHSYKSGGGEVLVLQMQLHASRLEQHLKHIGH